MRKRVVKEGITVNAIAGTHVVTLGFDLAETRRSGCLGFAIQREDHTEDERYWMDGMKTFKQTDPGLGPGGRASTRAQPLQTFQWADYSAKPDHEYTYTVVPLYGAPDNLRTKAEVSVRVRTESEEGKPHSAFFNRGGVSSQEYARRFQNQPPDKVGEAAYRWLSRGLLEAFESFLERAKDRTHALYGAIYEFQWPAALVAVKRASAAGAQVSVIFDDIQGGNGPAGKNEDAIKNAGIKGLCIGRSKGKLMHNKFFVLTRNDKPVAVWTGSGQVPNGV